MHQLTSARSMRIRFAAGPDCSGPPTLGQRNVLAWIERQRDERSDVIWSVFPAPVGTGLDAIAATTRALVQRHEGLRTTYARTADGEPVQRVAGTGELAVEVLDDVPEAELPTVVEVDEAWNRPFDLATEFGVRVGVYTRAGRPFLLLLVVSHMAADFATVQILTREFLELLDRPEGADGGRPPHQPRDQAARELSPRGLRRAEASLRHWDSVLRRAPQCMFSIPPSPAGYPGQRQAVLRSRAVALALDAIVARTGASRSTVLFAAASCLLGHRTGNDSCVLVSLSSNRFAPGTRDYIGTIAQDSLTHLEIGGTFDEVVRRAGTATMRAYTHAQYEATRLYDVMGAVEYERGTRFHRDCVFSDLSVHRDLADEPDAADAGADRPVSAEELSALTNESELVFVPELYRQALFQFELYEAGSRATLMLLADTRFLPPTDIEAFLRAAERLLVAAAGRVIAIDELGEITGLPTPVRGEGWIRVDGCWVQPEAVQRLMDELDLVKSARVFVEDGDHGTSTLTAYVVPADPATSLGDLHLAAVAHLRDRFTAIAPQRYVLCADLPDDSDDPAAWRRLEPLAEGTGRLAAPPVGRPEEVWCPPQ
jgi:Condensation domain